MDTKIRGCIIFGSKIMHLPLKIILFNGNINMIFMFLHLCLYPFRNFKKILTADPEIIQYETFCPNSPICPEKILFGKTLLSCTDWKLSLEKFFQKSLERIKSQKDKAISKTNWHKEFFSKKEELISHLPIALHQWVINEENCCSRYQEN